MVEVVDVAAFEHETAPLISFHYLIQINNQLVQSSSLRFINIVQACINFNVLCMIRSRKQEKRPKLLSIKYVKHLIHYLSLRKLISTDSWMSAYFWFQFLLILEQCNVLDEHEQPHYFHHPVVANRAC